MGCGLSKAGGISPVVANGTGESDANAQIDSVLAAHISAVLGIVPESTEIKKYVAVLRSEGWDTPDDFDRLTPDELKLEPFCFKGGHAKKVAWSRERGGDNKVERKGTTIRGQCSICGMDVLDTQPRLKDPETGLYQHQNCQQSGAGPAVPSAASRTSVIVSAQAITDAKTKAAAAAEEAQAEVAAIIAAADAARATVIAQAKKRAEETLAAAKNEAVQIVATAQPPSKAPAQTIDHETASTASGSTRSRTSAVPARTAFLPTAPKTKQLLPNGKHAFLSYQWDVQEQVKEIKSLLNERQIKCWMDIDGGMKSDIYDSMAEGVQGAACVVCFMTQAYQDSANCKLELKFAQQSGVPIIPVMMQADFAAKGWLAILTAGSIWTPMYEKASVPGGVEKLIEQAQHVVPGMHGSDDTSDAASEASDATESFDEGAWGDTMFSLEDMREELDRLREETAPSAGSAGASVTDTGSSGGAATCKIPAMVPTLPRGLFVTAAMQSVLDAVVSGTSTQQIGFCGMGGIGKTTVSCWVARSSAVQTKFGMVAWVTLGQTPVLDSCIDLLHMQLTGSSLPNGLSGDQKNEHLKQAFLKQSVLLVLDDCWNADVIAHFNWVDQHTNSKLLISSRVRDVLDGGEIITVAVPSKPDSVKMLLSTAGMDIDALQGLDEVAHIVELCKRLPLTIGVAGKLIRQISQGSSMSESSDWTEVVALLEDEMNDPGSSMSVEESVIRASIKSIPKKIRQQVTQLFLSFALVPEDTLVPLPVLGMVFDACGGPANSPNPTKPLSRLQVRRYLKTLIDRSLVLGTVDRPQLHDVMLDYVQKELAGQEYQAAQRQLVEGLRKGDRSTSTATGRYIQQNVPHHIKESFDVAWERSEQAISWLEDHVGGVQGVISTAAASVLPGEALAKEAEAAGMWWQAALRWNALGLFKAKEGGAFVDGTECFKLAVDASAKASVDLVTNSVSTDASFTQAELDMFDVNGINSILKAWDPVEIAKYGERYRKTLATEAGRKAPLLRYSAAMQLGWFPALMSGSMQASANAFWEVIQLVLDFCDPQNTATEDSDGGADVRILKSALFPGFYHSAEALFNAPGFSWDLFGPNGDMFVDYFNAFEFETHHSIFGDLLGVDNFISIGAPQFVLSMQYGRVAEAMEMNTANLVWTKQVMEMPSSSAYALEFFWSSTALSRSYHMFGMPSQVQAHFKSHGITFENAEERLDEVLKPMQGGLMAPVGQKGPGGGFFSLTRCAWQIKSFCVLNMDVMNVSESNAVAWLESLPDNETIYEYSVLLPTHDLTAIVQAVQFCWTALAHEKCNLYSGALRFADLQLEPDLLKAGNPLTKWPQVIALACKGRVLAKLNRHDEALIAFQAAIATSKKSYNLMEAFAYRELSNYAAGGDAAVQAGVDLEAKLKTFEGRMTRADFDRLTIGPGSIVGAVDTKAKTVPI